MTIQSRIDLRDRAVQAALTFAGRTVSSGDGSYGLLITVIQGAIEDCCKIAVEEERERLLAVVDEVVDDWLSHEDRRGWNDAQSIKETIRALVEKKTATT